MNAELINAVNKIRSLDALIILGAGASYEVGMPLAGQLAPLVWHTLDRSPILLNRLCEKLGVTIAKPKQVVGDDWDRVSCAFEFIANDIDARRIFQTSFVNLNDARSQYESAPHIALARLVFARAVVGVVSLNWDTLLENAFQNLFGFWPSYADSNLWKPHGDCKQPNSNWSFPHEAGIVPDSLIQRIQEFDQIHPRVLLIVGYSERDKTVIERLVAPLSERWSVFRVGPSASGEGAIQLDAATALTYLADELAPEPLTAGWQSVSYKSQRGIEAAVAGESLGPRDVSVCPHLPHFRDASRQLDLLHKVHISGSPGCGKSVTIWQLAYHYHNLGWHVIQPERDATVSEYQKISFVRSTHWPTVVVVDDTQSISERFLHELQELSDDKTKVVLGTTDIDWQRDKTIRISASDSVRALAKEFRERRDEILPIVQQFDSQVGDDFLSIRIEDRIRSAENSETPWQFTYVIRGAWKETRRILGIARDFEANDLLLTAIAARQLISLDVGASMAQLIKDTRILGRDEFWVQTGIQRLKAHRILLCGESIRCVHLRSASAILDLSLDSRSDDVIESLAQMFRGIVSEPESSLLGIYWLLFQVGHRWSRITTPEIRDNLLQNCFNSSSHIQRKHASYVVAHMFGHDYDAATDIIERFGHHVLKWIAEVNAEDAHALGGLINNLYNALGEGCRNFLSAIDPRLISEKIPNFAVSDGYVWGNVLGRLSVGTTKEWRVSFSNSLRHDEVRQYVRRFQPAELEDLSEFLCGMSGFDFNFALECFEDTLEVYQAAFARSPLESYRKLNHLEFILLGNSLFEKPRPTNRQRVLTKAMFEAIEPLTITDQMLLCPFGDWEYYSRLLHWIGQVHPAKITQIVEVIKWDKLDTVIGDKWTNPPRELRLLLRSLAANDACEPIRSWVAARSSRIDRIDPILSGTSPEAAISVFRNGKQVDLGGHNGSDWELQAWAILRIATVNEDVAKSVLRQNKLHFVKSIKEMSLPDGLPNYLDLVHQLDADFLPKIIGELAPADVHENWIRALQDHRENERCSARQVLRKIVAVGEGPVCDLADQLLRKVT